MPRKRRHIWSTISLPQWVIDKLKTYGEFGESWPDLMLKLMQEVDEAKLIKARYKLK